MQNTISSNPDISGSEYIWVQLPLTTKGTGNVSIFTNNIFYDNYQVEWKRFADPGNPPVSFTINYNWFRHWAGKTQLQATFFKNSTISIKHSVISINAMNPSAKTDLPYNQSFTFQTTLLNTEWNNLSRFLLLNNAVNWQSWNYTPLCVNYGDLGGWKMELSIDWNMSYKTVIESVIDDDSGSNNRILVSSSASEFQNQILSIVTSHIQNYLTTTSTSTSTSTPGNTLIFQIICLITFICLIRRRRVISGQLIPS